MAMVEQILVSLGSAFVYSIVFYSKKYARGDGEKFDYYKFGATMVVGLVIGIGFTVSGRQLTSTTFMELIAANIGTIAVVESIIKALYRQFRKSNDVVPQ